MSKLTLDEAIKYCLEVAEKNECKMTNDDGYTDVSMKQCITDYRQLAEWLTELKEAKRLLKLAVEDINFAYFCFQAACKNVKCEVRCPYYNKDTKSCSMGWRYYKEAERFIK